MGRRLFERNFRFSNGELISISFAGRMPEIYNKHNGKSQKDFVKKQRKRRDKNDGDGSAAAGDLENVSRKKSA